jgi:hypothetical protein
MHGLTNYGEHPTEINWIYFFFHKREMANYFEQLLIESKIDYEKEWVAHKKAYYFFIKKHYFKQAQKMNFLTWGKFREKFMPDKTFRWFVIIVTLILILLAVAGAVISHR